MEPRLYEPINRTYVVRYLRTNLQQIYNKSNSCTTSLQHSTNSWSLLYNKSTKNQTNGVWPLQ